MTVTLNDVEEALREIRKNRLQEDGGKRPPILRTPCIRAPWLEALALEAWGSARQDGFEVRLKLETWQETASFKQRGAFNKLRCLRDANPGATIRVYAASAGNHAQGVARHARDFDIHATIVMPTGTPKVKVENTERLLGKPVELFGENYDEARAHCESMCDAAESKYKGSAKVAMVKAFDDPAVIAGQGTLGLELLKDWPKVEVVVAGVGGGGLVAGIAVAMKERAAKDGKPAATIVGVESAAEPAAYLDRLHRHGKDKPLNIAELKLKLGTIADGISVAAVGVHTAEIMRNPEYVDQLLTVQESEIARAIVIMLRKGKMLIEGACATTVAALLNPGNQTHFAGKKVVLVLSGGNLDPSRLAQIIHWYDLKDSGEPEDRGAIDDGDPGKAARVIGRHFADFVDKKRQSPDDAWEEASGRPRA